MMEMDRSRGALLVLLAPLIALSSGCQLASRKYVLVEGFSGPEFFSHFNFETFPDPTHGFVEYVSRPRAQSLDLISTDAKTGRVRIAVDSKNIASAPGRPAVRLSSKTAFTTGLFIMDVNHVPEGNGTWPALWSFGPDWPNSGEIDVIEGVNDQPADQSTVHTSAGCAMPVPEGENGLATVMHQCDADDGCTVRGAAGSFGPAFNARGGGVYALLWTKSSISIWFWPRGGIPPDVAGAKAPEPRSWGPPTADFRLGSNCPSRHFSRHNLTINTTLCGDWAGNDFVGPAGRGREACEAYVAGNPTKFAQAYWDINGIRAYLIR